MENNTENIGQKSKEMTVQMAILIAGVAIAGSILVGSSWISGKSFKNANDSVTPPVSGGVVVAPVKSTDQIMGNASAPITLVEYADFQCPYCGKFFQEVEQPLIDSYVKNGKVKFVYRDYTFLGSESKKAAEAARCAGDQGKFWEYHDFLFNHQAGENQGAFSDINLKSFAQNMTGMNVTQFNNCLDSSKYTKAVADSTAEGNAAGVQGTPKGYIMKNGKVVSTIDGAEPLSMVTDKLDKALK